MFRMLMIPCNDNPVVSRDNHNDNIVVVNMEFETIVSRGLPATSLSCRACALRATRVDPTLALWHDQPEDHFCEREWPVKGDRKRLEAEIPDPFYLTAKGLVKRRPV